MGTTQRLGVRARPLTAGQVTGTLSSSQAHAAPAASFSPEAKDSRFGEEAASSPTEGYPVDPCFGESPPARFSDTYHNFDSHLYTFEEFIRCPESSRSTATLDSVSEPACVFEPQSTGEFHSIPLDSARGAPDSQPPLARAKYSKRSSSYAVKETEEVNQGPSNSRTCFQRFSQITPSANPSGYDPPEDPQPLEASSLARNLASNSESLQLERSTRTNTVYQAQYSNGLMMKFLCCFQSAERDEQYRIADSSPQPQKYSWDVERPDPSHYTFSNEEGKTLVKRPGAIGGQQFVIENCYDCTLLVLDHVASVTVDDCKDCLIVLGPCKGSVFIRDSSNCTVYTACQQFRTRDSFLSAFVFCATAPIVEESTVEFFPLNMTYNGIEEHMAACELSPFTNRWSEVHNFTPEASRFTISGEPSPDSLSREMRVRINEAAGIEGLKLIGPDSYFFVTLPEKQLERPEERVLILVKALNNQPKEELYACASTILRDLMTNPTIRLLETHDLNLREGELDAVLQQKNTAKLCGKLISIEVCGAEARAAAEARTSSLENVDVVVAEKAGFYRKQLYRLAEIQHSI